MTTTLADRRWEHLFDRHRNAVYRFGDFVAWKRSGGVWNLQRSTWGTPSPYATHELVDDFVQAALEVDARVVAWRDVPLFSEATSPVATPPSDSEATTRIVDLLDAVAQLRHAQARVDAYVSRARAAGASWSEVGAALGISRQGARQKYGV